MTPTFAKATKKQLKARIALLGPAGSGKTYTALRLAFALAGPTGRVAGIDTEHRSMSKYVGEAPDGRPWEFDVLELDSFSPENYIEGIRAAEAAGYDVLIIDSLSHAWAGKGGILEFVDEVARKGAVKGGRENTFGAWREATPKHNELVEAMLGARLHLIVTMRVKTEYVQEQDPQTGKTRIVKRGLQPIQRDGLEYEFDIVADMDGDRNSMLVSKSRCPALAGRYFEKPGPEVVALIESWLDSGAPAQPQPASVTRAEAAAGDTRPSSQQNAQPAQPWTSDPRARARLHLFIDSECGRTGLSFPRKGPQSAYERIKREQFHIEHLEQFQGTAQEFKNGVIAWFNAEAERQQGEQPPLVEEVAQ